MTKRRTSPEDPSIVIIFSNFSFCSSILFLFSMLDIFVGFDTLSTFKKDE